MRLFFIISLPRSGSTLLQRLLMAHPKVRTCGEPWLALPLALMFERDGGFRTYGHASLVRSGVNLCEKLPGGEKRLMQIFGRCAESVYGELSQESEAGICFIDKTPRYYKIIPQLVEMFPDAGFIVLRRDPLAVFASIINYIEGKLHLLPTWEQDIVEGLPKLAEAIDLLGERAIMIDYEGLVSEPNSTLRKIYRFMDLEFDSLHIDLSQTYVERGDQTGMRKYREVSSASICGWKDTMNSFPRKSIAVSWLKRVEESAFTKLGYSKDDCLERIRLCDSSLAIYDWASWFVGHLYFNYQLNVFRWGARRRRNGQPASLY